MLRTSKNFLTIKARKVIYYSLFHCHLIYCLPIWSCSTTNNIKGIITMQKKAIRIVSGSSYNAHTEPIFKELRILPLSKLILYFNLQLMQKFKQGFLPCSFNSVWSLNSVRLNATSEISLRNQEQLDIPFVRLASSEKMPLLNLPRNWEKFSDESIKILRNCR